METEFIHMGGLWSTVMCVYFGSIGHESENPLARVTLLSCYAL